MARILLFQHVPYEPLGTLSPLIRERGHRVRYINFSRSPDAHPNVEKYDALIILGGPANVDQVAQYPHLKTEMDTVLRAMERDIPILGICLGSQIIAGALGANVYPAKTKEIGWTKLTPTEAGKNDHLFQHWHDEENIFQWHGYTFDLPKDAVLLATGEQCVNQAFRIGQHAYGFQFHLEINSLLIARWLSLPIYQPDLNQDDIAKHATEIALATKQNIENTYRLAKQVFGAFLDFLPTVDRKRSFASR